MPSRLQFDLSPRTSGATRQREGAPMRLLVMADFSGRAAAEKPPLAERQTLRVDANTLEGVMKRLAPGALLAGTWQALDDLDAFHPDALVRQLPVFDALRSTREQLMDPARFAQAAARLDAAPPAAASPSGPITAGEAAEGDLLASLLGGKPAGIVKTPSAQPVPASAAAGIEAFVRGLVAPHIVPTMQPQQARLVASVDSAIAAQMRELLHGPSLQALESAWRGVHWLVSNLELDELLQVHLLDVSRDELMADVIAAQGQLAQTGLHRALADRWRNSPGAHGWSALVGLYAFGPSDADIGLAAALGLVASQAGGPLLAAADLALATADAAALAGWAALRRSEAAPWIGLAAPRLLLRRPYGRRSEPVAAFDFEEFPGLPEHAHFLWGAGSLAVALLIARAFATRGWQFEPGDEREIDDLPAFSYLRDGEAELQACAEHYLGEQAGQALLSAGLMPLLSHRNRNAVTVPRFQSIAEPAQALAGFGRG